MQPRYYLLISDRAHSDPTVRMAGSAATGLWFRLAAWAVSYHPGNWEVPATLVRKWGTAVQIARLVNSGLARATEAGYVLDDDLLGYVRKDQRSHIPAVLRQAVFDRDGHACLRCSATDDLTLDHIFPWSLGGSDTYENLRVLCRSCNSSKGATV